MLPQDTKQGSADWLSARAGCVTASRIADMMAKTKTGWGASRANYAAQLVAERLTGVAVESYTNSAMQWGLDTEPQARAAYEFMHDATVIETGFVTHPVIPMSGASPDGLVAEHGLIEIKCPNTATHIETLLGREVPSEYIYQIQWQLACTNRSWCDFVSFDPRMPEHMRLFVSRVERNGSMIMDLETRVHEFLKEIEATVSQLRANYKDAT
jgi:putative phage-type endonuclease